MASNPNSLKTLTKAILKKQCVAIRNEGQSRLISIEPHVIYTDSDNNIVLDFFQHRTATDESKDGLWDTIKWRNIEAVFWLNNSFTPRLKQGFIPEQNKYKTGLLAMVTSGSRPDKRGMKWEHIEASIDQLLLNS